MKAYSFNSCFKAWIKILTKSKQLFGSLFLNFFILEIKKKKKKWKKRRKNSFWMGNLMYLMGYFKISNSHNESSNLKLLKIKSITILEFPKEYEDPSVFRKVMENSIKFWNEKKYRGFLFNKLKWIKKKKSNKNKFKTNWFFFFNFEIIQGIWIKIKIQNSNLIPILVEHSFYFHHSRPDHLVLCAWLPKNEENKLPEQGFFF